jgi:bifunctional enzyme CysN/CysC
VIRSDDFRGFAGRILAGAVRPGDSVVALPPGRETRVRRIVGYGGDLAEAIAGQSVLLQLEDEVDIGRGDMISARAGAPSVSRRFSANLVWMGDSPLQLCRPYLVKHTTRQACAEVVGIRGRVRLETLEVAAADRLVLNEIGVVDLEVHRPLVFDPYTQCRGTGSFVLIDLITNRTVAGGMILADGQVAETAPGPPTAASSGGLTIWLTGLSGAGKTTLAEALYEQLRAANLRVELLDGDAIRKHLSKGLGFDRGGRDENIRRIGFVANLLTRNGVVAIVAAISPYRAARDAVRREVGRFVEVFVNAPLEVCEQRDGKGLYRLARAGGLPGFTGIDDPYEPPLNPEVECHTDRESIAECLDRILAAIRPILRVNRAE